MWLVPELPTVAMRPSLPHRRQPPPTHRLGDLSKRLFDVMFAAVGLLALFPVFLVVAAFVKLDGSGSVVFRQARVGLSGRQFVMFKFRSMVFDADQHLADLLLLNESDGLLFKIREDPRVTRVGRFLRRYSLDELPQLVNVLRGEMSLVGPRPPLPTEVERYVGPVRRRLLVRPGLSGLWQVSGRSDLSWDEAIRLDLHYVDNWSMKADLVILAKTAGAVLGKTGAY